MRQEIAYISEQELEFDEDLDLVLGGIGYGNDPDVMNPSAPWKGSLTEHDLNLIGRLSDIFLPKTGQYPAPSEIGIAEFFNHWLSAPYSKQQKHKEIVITGIAQVDIVSNKKFGEEFLMITESQQTEIVEEMAKSWAVKEFFDVFQYLVVGGYFTTDIGYKAIGYRGNVVVLPSYPDMPVDIKQMVEDELKKLGL